MRLKVLTMLLFGLAACDPYVPEFPAGTVEGVSPIYADANIATITKSSARGITTAGKIYSIGNVLLINDVNLGIHVIDNSDPTDPKNVFFIRIPGNSDIAVKDGHIYANNFADLVVLNINNDSFSVVSRIKDLFLEPAWNTHPTQRDVYYECVDPKKGMVIGWEKALIHSPECYKR
jgi:hypothetical protein